MRNHNIKIDKDKSVYSQGLAVILYATRTDRPNEWQMDEHADMARDLELNFDKLQAENERLRDLMKVFHYQWFRCQSEEAQGYLIDNLNKQIYIKGK